MKLNIIFVMESSQKDTNSLILDENEIPHLDEKLEHLSEREILWNSAGMHRPIASFWYNYIFILIAALPGLLVIGWFIPSVLMPYPSSLGIANVVTSYFQFMFVMFDVGTGIALQRFASEHAAKDPKRAIKYISFFSWFQLITGLLQTTIIAIFVLTNVRNGNEGYLTWSFLIYSLTQYPGMLMVYKNALGAFQRHDKEIIVELFHNVLFQSLTQIFFILLGKWWGINNPEIGEVMGAAIGFIIGSYIDDFVGMALGAYFFHNVLKPLELSVIDSIRPSFDKDIAKEVIVYGLKVVPAYAIEAGVQFLILIMTLNWIPNYTTIIAIFQLANSVSTITSIAFTITPAISESYNNNYHNLTQYYIKNQWFHWSLIACFLFTCVYMLLPPAFRILAGNYAIAADIIPILLITRIFIFPINFGSNVAQGINKPEYQTYALFFEQTARLFTYFAFLNPYWGLITVMGTEYALILYSIACFPGYLVKLFFQWYFVKKTIKFSVSPPAWQTFVAPVLSQIPIILFLLIPVRLFEHYAALSNDITIPVIILGATLLLGLFLFPMFVLYPCFGLFGGWDDDTLKAFEDSAKISGPSKFLVKIMAKTTRWGHEHSPFKNKHRIDFSKAKIEAQELTNIRLQNYLLEKDD